MVGYGDTMVDKKKYKSLAMAIIIDLIGNVSYLFPGVGEWTDTVWGLLSGGILMFVLFPKRKIGGAFGALEEILPGTDIVPTATILWILDYVVSEKVKLTELPKESSDDEIRKEK